MQLDTNFACLLGNTFLFDSFSRSLLLFEEFELACEKFASKNMVWVQTGRFFCRKSLNWRFRPLLSHRPPLPRSINSNKEADSGSNDVSAVILKTFPFLTPAVLSFSSLFRITSRLFASSPFFCSPLHHFFFFLPSRINESIHFHIIRAPPWLVWCRKSCRGYAHHEEWKLHRSRAIQCRIGAINGKVTVEAVVDFNTCGRADFLQQFVFWFNKCIIFKVPSNVL